MTASFATVETASAPPAEAERAPRAANANEMAPTRAEPRSRTDAVGELHGFLEHRSRQWSSVLRLLEQLRLHVQAVEAEREAEHRKLEAAMAAVEQPLRALKAAADPSRENRASGELDKVIESNRVALDQLETVAANLNTNFLVWRSAWLQYAQTFEASRRLRADMESRLHSRA